MFSLRTMSYVTSYPSSLKQLDLSHNKICVWPSLPQIHLEETTPDQENLLCYRLETGQVPKSTVPAKIRTSKFSSYLTYWIFSFYFLMYLFYR